MTMFDDDGEEAFNAFLHFPSVEELEAHLENLRPNFTPGTEIVLGICGDLGDEPTAEQIDRVQKLQSSCPSPAHN